MAKCLDIPLRFYVVSRAPASLLAPFAYLQIVWATVYGFLLFGHLPDGWSIAGMAVIVLAGLYVANRQRLTMRRS